MTSAGRIALAVALAVTAGCGIKKEIHKRVVDQLARCRSDLDACKKARTASEDNAKDLRGQLEKVTLSRQQVETRLEQAQTELASMHTNLATTEDELSELRKQRAATNARLAAYRKLQDRLRALTDTGKLKVAFRKGQMVLELPSEILFSSGRAKLSRSGKEALSEVADVLLEFRDRRFMIAGHTDDVAIRTPRFPNNWYLSTTRAASVVEFFVEEGFAPENLAATGYGEFDPIGDNASQEGRALNRRIEIILVPDLSELPQLSEDPTSSTEPEAVAPPPAAPGAPPAPPPAPPAP